MTDRTNRRQGIMLEKSKKNIKKCGAIEVVVVVCNGVLRTSGARQFQVQRKLGVYSSGTVSFSVRNAKPSFSSLEMDQSHMYIPLLCDELAQTRPAKQCGQTYNECCYLSRVQAAVLVDLLPCWLSKVT